MQGDDYGQEDWFGQNAPAPGAPPPIYPGPAGTPYTDFSGQAQTVPTAPSGPNGPISTIDQPMWQDLWQQSGQNPQAFVEAVIGQLGLRGKQTDPTALNTILRALQAVGVNATLDQRGDQYHKGIMLDGHFVKLLDGSDRWMWGFDDDKKGSTSSGEVQTKPWTETFAYKPFDQKFTAPSAQDVEADPEFQAVMARGQKAIERSASAKGTLLTTGTVKDLQDLNRQEAGRTYGDIYNRKLGEHQMAFGEYQQGRNNAFQDYTQRYQQYGANDDRSFRNFMANYDIWKQGDDTAWNRPFQLAQLGYNAASGANNASSNYANAAGNLTTDIGNVNAAGQVGSSNAYGSALGNIAGIAPSAYLATMRSSYRPPQRQWAGENMPGFGGYG